VLTDQIKRNQIRYADARRSADGLMSVAEVRRTRDRLGLTQHEAAVLFGGGQNGFSKYERGEVTQSVSMDRLLRVVAAYPMLLEMLRCLAGVEAQACSANDYELAGKTTMPSHQARPRFRIVSGSKPANIDSDPGAVAA
jgi:DNA-binding transcriptional regulator YiaG